jgi:TolB-like protein/DNA-binding winged helix-turn-helix (wHTH) protein/Tfp pilus assembly protein PilF
MGTVFRFGAHESHPRSRELYKHGVKLKIRPQPLRLLNLLLSRAGDVVSREELRGQLWSADTFVDFEHSLNTSIRELRAALDDSATEPRYIETLPRLGYRFIAPVECLEPSLEPQPAWNPVLPFPTAIPRAENSGPPVVHAGYRRWFVPAVVLAVLIIAFGAYLTWSRVIAPPQPMRPKVVLAVLPFENLTGDASQDYFCDGLTEEMIAQLGHLEPQHLGVIARTSVMHYRNTKESLEQIGRELGVQYVAEGSVRRDADRVRISAQLIQVKDQTHVWAREYDRQLSGVLALQGEIAQDVARETRLTLENSPVPIEPGWKKRVASPSSYEAYDLYLKGRYFWNKRTKDGFQRAAEYFQEAIAKDPYYGQAYAGLADTYGLMSTWRLVPQNEFMPKAHAAARKALEIDETLAEAHTSLALVLENYDYDWQGAEREFRRAIELDPDYATAHQWYAEYLSWQGRFDEALQESERARQLDPLSLIVATDHGAILYFARKYDRAIAQFRAVLDMDPNFDRARLLLACAYVERGGFEEAGDVLEYRADSDDLPMTWGTKVYVYGRWGRPGMAQQSMAKVQQIVRQSQADPSAGLLFAYLGLNQKDQAIALLRKASLEHSNVLVGAKVAPYYDPLHSDPRFQALLKSIGLGQ